MQANKKCVDMLSPSKAMMLLRALEKNPNQLTRRHLKKIYSLLILSGHYPICPWCHDYIYNIKDFTWDHIVPKSAGGGDSLDNLQPMHKHCNNEAKADCVYQEDYRYDIQTELEHTILDVRVVVSKNQKQESKKRKGKYNNNKRRVKTRSRQR